MKRMSAFRILPLALVCLLAAPPLASQKPAPRRGGQWLGIGVGSGFGRVSCPICQANRKGSISGYVKAGGTLNRRTLLGMEANGWMRSDDGADELMVALAGSAYWYPNSRKRLFYKAGIGVMHYKTDDGPNRLTSTAFGPQLGAGYDVPIGPSVSVTPFANWLIASLGGELTFNGERFRDDVGLMLVQLGVGVTWH
jgi:hypothetical protein